jgi:hypothetical protein
MKGLTMLKTIGKITKVIAIVYATIFLILLGMIMMTSMMLSGLATNAPV